MSENERKERKLKCFMMKAIIALNAEKFISRIRVFQ